MQKIAVAGLSVAATVGGVNCGKGADENGKSASVQQHRQAIQMQIVRELTPLHNNSEFTCLRLPVQGPYVIFLASGTTQITNSHDLLQRYKINGDIEIIKSDKMYKASLGSIRQHIEKTRPKEKAFAAVDVYVAEEPRGAAESVPDIICPKVFIALGRKGAVSPRVLEWAQGLVTNYGSDRVKYKYSIPNEAEAA